MLRHPFTLKPLSTIFSTCLALSFLSACGAEPNDYHEDLSAESDQESEALRRGGVHARLWPGGVIPYVIEEIPVDWGSNTRWPSLGAEIIGQASSYGRWARLKMVPRTTEKDYVVFRMAQAGDIPNSDVWYSDHFGKKGGAQNVFLTEHKCNWADVVQAIAYVSGGLNKTASDYFGDPNPSNNRADGNNACYYYRQTDNAYDLGPLSPANGVCTTTWASLSSDYDAENFQNCEVIEAYSFNAGGLDGCTGYGPNENRPIKDVHFPNLKEVRGNFSIHGAGSNIQSVSFPQLKKVTGTFAVEYQKNLKTISLPALESVGRDVALQNNRRLKDIKLPALNKIGRRLKIMKNGQLQTLDVGPSLHKRRHVKSVRIRKNGTFPRCGARRCLDDVSS